jgi:threonine synthase
MDTHTAVAASVYKKYSEAMNDGTKTVIVSTASPYKFTRSVMTSIDERYNTMDDFDLVDELHAISKVDIPDAIEEIRTAAVIHDTFCEVDEMKQTVKTWLGIK